MILIFGLLYYFNAYWAFIKKSNMTQESFESVESNTNRIEESVENVPVNNNGSEHSEKIDIKSNETKESSGKMYTRSNDTEECLIHETDAVVNRLKTVISPLPLELESAALVNKIIEYSSVALKRSLLIYRTKSDQGSEWLLEVDPVLITSMYRSLIAGCICVLGEKALTPISGLLQDSMTYYRNLKRIPPSKRFNKILTDNALLEWILESKDKLTNTVCKLGASNKKFSLVMSIIDQFGITEVHKSILASSKKQSSYVDTKENDLAVYLSSVSETNAEWSVVLSPRMIVQSGSSSDSIWSCLLYCTIEINLYSESKSSKKQELVEIGCYNIKRALRLFSRIPSPSPKDYINVIRALKLVYNGYAVGHWDKEIQSEDPSHLWEAAVELFERIRARAMALSTEELGQWMAFKSNMTVCNTIISVCAKAGSSSALRKSIEIFEQIKAMHELTDKDYSKAAMPDDVMYATVVKGILQTIEKHDTEDERALRAVAFRYFKEIKGQKTDLFTSTATLVLNNVLVHILKKNNVKVEETVPGFLDIFERVIKVAAKAQDENSCYPISTHRVSLLIKHLCVGNGVVDLETATGVYDMWMSSVPPKYRRLEKPACLILLKACCEHMDIDFAYRILEDLAAGANYLDEPPFKRVLHGLVKEKRKMEAAKRAETIVMQIMPSINVPITYTVISLFLKIKVNSGDIEGSFNLLRSGIKGTEISDIRHYMDVAVSAAKARKGHIALEAYKLLIKNMNSQCVSKNDRYSKSDVLHKFSSDSLLRTLLYGGFASEAKSIMNLMKDNYIPFSGCIFSTYTSHAKSSKQR